MTYRTHHHAPRPGTMPRPQALAAEACSYFALRLRARYDRGEEGRAAQRELQRRALAEEVREDPHALD